MRRCPWWLGKCPTFYPELLYVFAAKTPRNCNHTFIALLNNFLMYPLRFTKILYPLRLSTLCIFILNIRPTYANSRCEIALEPMRFLEQNFTQRRLILPCLFPLNFVFLVYNNHPAFSVPWADPTLLSLNYLYNF
jgi:hypothetical protein